MGTTTYFGGKSYNSDDYDTPDKQADLPDEVKKAINNEPLSI